MFKINILILTIALLIGLPISASAKSNDFTAVIYLEPGKSLPSDNSSTLFVERGNVGIISRPITESRKLKYQVSETEKKDFYLTVTYSSASNYITIYNHTTRIGRMSLSLFDLDLNNLITDLRSRSSNGDIDYYKDYKFAFSSRQIKSDYEKNYQELKKRFIK